MRHWLLLSVIGLLHVREAVTSIQCACATTDVHVRDGPGVDYSILGTLAVHKCTESLENYHKDSFGDSWAHVSFHNKDGWIHENFIHLTYSADCGMHSATSASQLPGCPRIVSRQEWHARSPKWTIPLMTGTPKYMFIHHGETAACHTKADCIQKVKSYQNYHMDTHGIKCLRVFKGLVQNYCWPDIGFNFIVGEDGNVYEGRGWKQVGAHTHGYNDVGIAICIIGDFSHRTPNDAALTAVKDLIGCAAANHKLDSHYILRGHRDVVATDCPGDSLYHLITTWPHYF